ncbi:glycosyltransferase [Streptomyces sp. NBC_01619]|uniref:tetratricopeptide repeat-containing glycosyltransferase n=1 Tax=Streptomyces sp. NBC_01619 TaxID=2975901 RepID=UPI00224ED6C9|nr:glycosyltransferase [Streptomyces sp. NBC_01619]MCX4515813.1 glycosyltransferase [Streptomyces sp. NBC_01619]
MKPSICLCMIVKNESKVIERCLASVRGLIDTWVVSDTGSTDGTQDLIRQTLEGIPGELYEEPWVNFGHNRTLNIAHARDKADYLLLLDADLTIRQDHQLPPLTADAYMIRHEGQMEYRIRRLVRGNTAWRYEGVTHEYLTTESAVIQENLDALVVVDFADGGSRHDKFERDERLLKGDLERNPDNSRTVFYLAQTLRDMGRANESADLYERRAAMGGWPEEVYYSLLQAGILKAETGDWPGGMDALTRAFEARPTRLEACYELSSRLRIRGRYHAAHLFSSVGLGRPAPDDVLFVSPWVYRYGMLFEHSITAYWVGDYASSVKACDRLLAMKDLPEEYRKNTLSNRQFAVARLAETRPAGPPHARKARASTRR